MLYLSRTGNVADLFVFLAQCGVWATGGWLLVSHTFRLHDEERLMAGLGTGFVLFIGTLTLFGS